MGLLSSFKRLVPFIGRKSITVHDKVSGWSLLGLTQGAQNFRTTTEQLEAVRKIGHVSTCVKIIGQTLANIPYATVNNSDKTVKDANLEALLERPNTYQSGYEFRNLWVWHLLLSGNAIVLCTANDALAVKEGRIQSMWLLDPSKIEIEIENEITIKSYRYREGTLMLELPKELIFHARLPNPQSRFWGLGVIAQDQLLFDEAYSAKLFNYNFFANGARLDGYLHTEQPMQKEVASDVLEAFKRVYGGTKNQGKTALFHSGIKYQPLSPTQTDMAFEQLSKMSRENIFSLFGLPAALVGLDPAANFKIDELKNLFNENTINPLRMMYTEFMTQIVRAFFNKGWKYWMEEVVTSKKEKLRGELNGWVASGIITRNEAREFLDLDKLTIDFMDTPTVPMNVLPISDVGYSEPVALPAGEPAKAMLPAANTKAVKAANMHRKLLILTKKEKKRFGPRFEKAMKKFWKGQLDRVLETVDQMLGKGFEHYDAKAVINNEQEATLLLEALMPEHTGMVMVAAQNIASFTGIDFDNSTQNPGIVSAIRKVSNKTKMRDGMNQTTRDKITEIVSRGTDDGKTVNDIKSEITEMFSRWSDGGEEITTSRARMIARTEAGVAYDEGSREVYQVLGYEKFGFYGCEDAHDPWDCNKDGFDQDYYDAAELHPNHTGSWLPMPEEFTRLEGV